LHWPDSPISPAPGGGLQWLAGIQLQMQLPEASHLHTAKV
jgi:hypothetical protein